MTQPQEPRLRRRVLEVWAIKRLGIQEDGHGVVERDAVFRRVGLGLPRVPLEHLFSIYEMRGVTGTCVLRVPAHTASYAVIAIVLVSELRHIPLETPGQHGDLREHADVCRMLREVVDPEVRWWDLMCVSTTLPPSYPPPELRTESSIDFQRDRLVLVNAGIIDGVRNVVVYANIGHSVFSDDGGHFYAGGGFKVVIGR